jgi:hypothetical protein
MPISMTLGTLNFKCAGFVLGAATAKTAGGMDSRHLHTRIEQDV